MSRTASSESSALAPMAAYSLPGLAKEVSLATKGQTLGRPQNRVLRSHGDKGHSQEMMGTLDGGAQKVKSSLIFQ